MDDMQDIILEHYESPYHRGKCPSATHSCDGVNSLCGDRISIQLRIDGCDIVQDAWFEGEGCCISQSAASMLVEWAMLHHIEGIRQFTADDMLKMFGAQLSPNRQQCCLLSWRVMLLALQSEIRETKK